MIETVEIATTGNATDFGDLWVKKKILMLVVDHQLVVLIGGGYNPYQFSNNMNLLPMSSQGGANDFGDLIVARSKICWWIK